MCIKQEPIMYFLLDQSFKQLKKEINRCTNPNPRSAGANRPNSLIGPTPANCPMAISRKNTGRPAVKSMMI